MTLRSVAALHDESDLGGHLVEVASLARQPRGARDALTRNFRMQLEREPRRLDATFRHQPVDSRGVDVAPGSDEVGIDEELGRQVMRVAPQRPRSGLNTQRVASGSSSELRRGYRTLESVSVRGYRCALSATVTASEVGPAVAVARWPSR